MKHSQLDKYNLIIIGICLLAMVSCRKKDEKYEGTYIGTERHSIHDSTGTIYSLDTTYQQEFYIDYSKTKKYYSITKSNDPNGSLTTVHKNDIVNHEHYPFGEIWNDTSGNTYGYSAYLKFAGDSMYFNASSSTNWEFTNYEFSGKRN